MDLLEHAVHDVYDFLLSMWRRISKGSTNFSVLCADCCGFGVVIDYWSTFYSAFRIWSSSALPGGHLVDQSVCVFGLTNLSRRAL